MRLISIFASSATRELFQDIQFLTQYLLFGSWQPLIDLMLDESMSVISKNTS